MHTIDGSRKEVKKCIRVTDKNLFEYLGKEKYRPDKANKHPEVGVVRDRMDKCCMKPRDRLMSWRAVQT
ncbi:MAG: hypothetical protein ACLT33_12265 [Lachnospira pectinoschiza]